MIGKSLPLHVFSEAILGTDVVAKLFSPEPLQSEGELRAPMSSRVTVTGVLALDSKDTLRLKPLGKKDWIRIPASLIACARVLSSVAGDERAFVAVVEFVEQQSEEGRMFAQLLGAHGPELGMVTVPDACIEASGKMIHLVSYYGGLLFAFEYSQSDNVKHLAHGPGVTTQDGRWKGVREAYTGWRSFHYDSPLNHVLQFECDYPETSGAWMSYWSDLNGGAALVRSRQAYSCERWIDQFVAHIRHYPLGSVISTYVEPNTVRYLRAVPPEGVSLSGEVRWVERFSNDCYWTVRIE